MKLMSWNVNGIRALLRKDALLPLIKAEEPDILCLQETKAQPGEAAVDLPYYQRYWHSAEKKGYSGTALFTKSRPLSVVNGLPRGHRRPLRSARRRLRRSPCRRPCPHRRVPEFFLVNVYTPNAKEDLSRLALRAKHWDPAFLAYCIQLEKKKPVVFCGDLNVAHTELDLANPKANKGKKGFTDEERAGFQAFLDSGFVDTLRLFKQGNGLYTWWSNFGGARERNVGWRIDYFLVSGPLRGEVTGGGYPPVGHGLGPLPGEPRAGLVARERLFGYIPSPMRRIRILRAERVGSAFALSWRRDFEFTAGQLVEVALEEKGPSRLYSLFTGPDEDEAGILFTVAEGGELTPSLARLGAGRRRSGSAGPRAPSRRFAGRGSGSPTARAWLPSCRWRRAGLSEGKTLLHGARAPEDFYFQAELEGRMGERYLRCRSGQRAARLAVQGAACSRAADRLPRIRFLGS